MACENAETSEDALLAAVQGPAEVTSDGQTVKQHKLTDLIEADKYLSAKCAAGNTSRGIRFTKFRPGGPTD